MPSYTSHYLWEVAGGSRLYQVMSAAYTRIAQSVSPNGLFFWMTL
jgi:hypothetical protein